MYSISYANAGLLMDVAADGSILLISDIRTRAFVSSLETNGSLKLVIPFLLSIYKLLKASTQIIAIIEIMMIVFVRPLDYDKYKVFL